MDLKILKRSLLQLALVFWVFALLVYLVAGSSFRYTAVTTDSLTPSIAIGELVDGNEITQQLSPSIDRLDSIELYISTFNRANTGSLLFVLEDNGSVLSQGSVDISSLADNSFTAISLAQPLDGLRGHTLTLRLSSQGCAPGNAVTLYGGSFVSTGRHNIDTPLSQEELYLVNGVAGPGTLCLKLSGINHQNFYLIYWPMLFLVFCAAAVYCICSYRAIKRGKENFLSAIADMFCKYRFLVKQLVIRDFKSKYKRSVLGVAWSFLNPLLTMAVQYLIFSTLFRSSIPNFPVYLLSGTVFYNFFSEAVSEGMVTITANAPLLKKVYVSKYVFPCSRVLSSLVNFVLAFTPLLLVMLFTHTPFRPSMFLLIYDVLCYMCFITGMVLIMSTSMVFFQDTQFLWAIFSMLWMYLTPIFYPASIIPQRLLPIYCLNPLYQFISFARTCIIDGISPQPSAYLGCLVPGVLFLGAGVYIFRKQQDRFIMYI